MTRVLFVSHVSALGGAEHSLVTLASALDPDRYDLHAALPSSDSPLGQSLRGRGVEVHGLPALRPLRRRDPTVALTLTRGRRAVASLARSLRPAIVHANSDVAMAYAVGLSATGGPRPLPWRTIWHLRDMRAAGPWMRYLRSRSDAQIAVSHAVLVHHRLGASPTCRVIHNGIDLSQFRPSGAGASVRSALGIPGEQFLCLCVAQAVPWKNLHQFAALAGTGYARLLVAYPPPGGTPTVCPEPRPGLSVVGYRDDMPAVYAAADLLVHPALGEAFGRTVVEAMACGLPVVAYRHGGPAETVEHGVSGLLADPGESGSLEAAVNRVVADRALRDRLAAGAVVRAQAFSAREHAAKVESLYEALVEGGQA